jgi:hypothetical protein
MHVKIFARTLRLKILKHLSRLEKLGRCEYVVLMDINRFGTRVGIAQECFIFEEEKNEFKFIEKFVVNESIFVILLPENVTIDHSR